MRKGISVIAGVLAAVVVSSMTQAAAPKDEVDGETVFYKTCARCHVPTPENSAGNRAPSVAALGELSRKSVSATLTTGAMWGMASGLSPAERAAVTAFLVPNDKVVPDMSLANKCQKPAALAASNPRNDWNGWGNDMQNTRYQPNTTITPANVGTLKLKWAFGIQDTNSVSGQPTVVGGRVFMGTGDGHVYALDAKTGCTIWAYKADGNVRAAVNVQKVGDRTMAFFADTEAKVYAVDAETGKQVWRLNTHEDPIARVTGAVQVYKDRVYVGINGSESYHPMDLNYVCCKFRGSLIALDAKTGKQVWKSYTIEQEPKFVKKKANGVDLYAPAGGGIWGAPTIDAERNVVYVGTGDCHVTPSADTCDAVIAYDAETGKRRWYFTGTANDAYNLSCPGNTQSETCSEKHPDYDFGSSVILLPGKGTILAGQKSGVIHALSANDNGATAWQRPVGEGSAGGGIMWGSAIDGENVYVANVRALIGDDGKALEKPGLSAVRISDGKVMWRALSLAATCNARQGCSGSMSAAVTAIPGMVFAGAKDGVLRAYAAKDGKVLWEVDTAHDFTSVNGVKAHGGSFSTAGATVVGNTLYVGSGHGAGGMPGNVLLAYELAN